jgi:hypothetical protein
LKVFARLCAVLAVAWAAAAGQGVGRNARGVVMDESNGVLPGVTVAAASEDGRTLVTGVTDGAGRYVIGPLPPGRVTLTFQLDGFAQGSAAADVGSDADAIVNQRLALAARSESVEVVGKLPRPYPPPPPLPPPVSRRRPVTHAVPAHDPDSVCGPAKQGARPESFGTVRARRYGYNGLYAKGDELEIDAGTDSGLEPGRNFTVRRSFRAGADPDVPMGEHSAGVVQIVSADERSAVAVVVYACDEIMPGDRLASFAPEPLRAPARPGIPDYRYAAKILFADLGQSMGAPSRLMVIDRGADSGVRVGQRATLFQRRPAAHDGRAVVGDAVVVAVRVDSATIRVEHVTDAVLSGDWAALQR